MTWNVVDTWWIMADRETFICRVVAQHGSRMVTVPARVCRGFKIRRGDYAIWKVDYDRRHIEIGWIGPKHGARAEGGGVGGVEDPGG